MAVTKEELAIYLRVKSEIEPQAKKAREALEALGKIGGTLKTALTVGLGAVTALGAGAVKLAADASGIPAIAQSFFQLGGSIETMRKSTAGMVSDAELMKNYNLAAQLVSRSFAEDLPQAMGYLQKVAAATGQSMDYMVNSLIVGVGRESKMILDNLAIQVDVTAASEAYAKSLGKKTDALTKSERQTALFNQVLEKLRDNTATMPDVMGTAAQALGSVQTQFANIKDQLGQALIPILQEVLPIVSDVGAALATAFASEEFKSGVIALAQGLADVLRWLTNLDPAAVKIGLSVVALGLALPKLATAFGVVKIAVAGLGAALAANPIGLIATGIVAAGLGIVAVMDMLKKKNEEIAASQEEASSRIAAGAETYEQYRQRMVDYHREQGTFATSYADIAEASGAYTDGLGETAAAMTDAQIAAQALEGGLMMDEGAFRSQAAAASLSSDALRGLEDGMLSMGGALGEASALVEQHKDVVLNLPEGYTTAADAIREKETEIQEGWLEMHQEMQTAQKQAEAAMAAAASEFGAELVTI